MKIKLICVFIILLLLSGTAVAEVNLTENASGDQTNNTVANVDNAVDNYVEDASEHSMDFESSEYSPSFSAASGQDSVQLGSLLFGSVTVSTDTRSSDLRRYLLTVMEAQRAGLITQEEAKEHASYVLKEIRKESKPSRCLGFIPCGKERKITNLFKLL